MARTLSDLDDRVGYLLDMTVSTTSDPSATEIHEWLNDAAREIAMIVDPAVLTNALIAIDDQSIAAVSEVTLPSDYLKFIAATLNVDGSSDDDYPMRRIPVAVAAQRYTNSLIEGSTEYPVLWIEEGKFKWKPATTGGAATGKLIARYVKLPSRVASNVVPATPEHFDNALINYAVAKAKIQEEEFQQYTVFMNEFYRIVTNFKEMV